MDQTLSPIGASFVMDGCVDSVIYMFLMAFIPKTMNVQI